MQVFAVTEWSLKEIYNITADARQYKNSTGGFNLLSFLDMCDTMKKKRWRHEQRIVDEGAKIITIREDDLTYQNHFMAISLAFVSLV